MTVAFFATNVSPSEMSPGRRYGQWLRDNPRARSCLTRDAAQARPLREPNRRDYVHRIKLERVQ